jgi:hypothetical protein
MMIILDSPEKATILWHGYSTNLVIAKELSTENFDLSIKLYEFAGVRRPQTKALLG